MSTSLCSIYRFVEDTHVKGLYSFEWSVQLRYAYSLQIYELV